MITSKRNYFRNSFTDCAELFKKSLMWLIQKNFIAVFPFYA